MYSEPYGHRSFNLVGYQACLQYCLKPSTHKLQADLDIPSRLTAFFEDLQRQKPQQDGRNGHRKAGKKRALLTFSEITDCFVEVRFAKDAWLLKKWKVAGDDVLFNTLGATNDVSSLVGKVLLLGIAKTCLLAPSCSSNSDP